MASISREQGKFDEAKPLIERSREIFEIQLGEHHPHVATVLNSLASLLKAQVMKGVLGKASLARTQGKFDEAKPLYERSLRIRETSLGEHHLDVATSLNNLAVLLKDQVMCSVGMASLKTQGKYDEAEPLYERSRLIYVSNLGKHHPLVAHSLNNIGEVLQNQVYAMRVGMASHAGMQGKYDEAKPLYEHSLRIRETSLGEHHTDVASSLSNLAMLLKDQVMYGHLEWRNSLNRRGKVTRPSRS